MFWNSRAGQCKNSWWTDCYRKTAYLGEWTTRQLFERLLLYRTGHCSILVTVNQKWKVVISIDYYGHVLWKCSCWVCWNSGNIAIVYCQADVTVFFAQESFRRLHYIVADTVDNFLLIQNLRKFYRLLLPTFSRLLEAFLHSNKWQVCYAVSSWISWFVSGSTGEPV